MRSASIVLVLLAGAACGPSVTQVRRYMVGSAHRQVAVFPFDVGPVNPNLGKTLAASFQNKLGNEGFAVADRGKTEKVYYASELSRGGAFGAVKDAASFAAALGSKAALVGRVDQALDRVEHKPAVYDYEPVPPPACCFAQKNPCANRQILDAVSNAWVPSCGGTHRRVLAQPARNVRLSRLALSVRLIDAASARVLWETSYAAELTGPLSNVSDAVDNILIDQLVDAYMKQGF